MLIWGVEFFWFEQTANRSISITDGGDVPEGLTLEEAHDVLRQKVSEVVAKGGIPFIVGGGNDQSYPNAVGWFTNIEQG